MKMKKFFSTLFDNTGNKVVMVNNEKGKIKESPAGFSWTTLIFGIWPALLRGDFLGALVILIISAMTGFNPVLYVLTSIFISIFYNYTYINRKIGKGYELATDNSKELLKKHGYDVNVTTHDGGDDNQ